MQLHISGIQSCNLHIHAGATSLDPALVASFFADTAQPRHVSAGVGSVNTGRPAIGEVWAGQGGIYAGDFQAEGGQLYGLIVATEQDIGKARWAEDGTRSTSEWDGLANTVALHDDCPAAKLASGYERDGHSDFYLPARRELQFTAATIPEKFGSESWYWSSTARSDSYAWAVDFENGDTGITHRTLEFRVRPFRRFIY